MTSTTPHLWRSDLLGALHTVELASHGRLEYFERGAGPTLVFAHGWLANANLWRSVVDALAEDFRCVVLDLPLGAHRTPLAPDADLTPTGCGALIAGVLDALDLHDVTLVGNDSGGAYSQIATAGHPERVARLVLNSCETPYDAFPPPPFDGLPAVARDSAALGQLFEALRDRTVRAAPVAFGLLIKHPIDDLVSDSYALPCLANLDVLRDTAKVMSSAESTPVHAAGAELIARFDRPVLFAWGPEDQIFPIAHAQRYAAALADAQVIPITDAYSFTPEDQPAALADEIRRCFPPAPAPPLR
ncbi:alpha/beta hydrolase [Baekduia sp.]|jgi:pimeloyl-ACP methyl ester carboxylesterase|uniref:alpha/beta fold hydrolase n=1 Tax=Baekduia sp. TaxID=2600305 RepID=UPI002E043729|nr:alpha/beta hydrolase [Baekduia sp.]